MATLNNANIINGNPVETADILQLYTALGTGSPGDITGLVITGSLDGSATSIVIPTPSTITGTYYPALVPGNGTQNPEISDFLSYNAATKVLTTTASYATTAENASVIQVNSQKYDDGGIVTGDFKFIAGKVAMGTGTAVSSAFLNLVGKTLGTDAFITANYISGNGPTDSVIVDSIDFATGVITFINNTSGSPVVATIVFTGIYI
jgi:hypothetical protein